MLKKCTIVALLFLTIVACKNNKTPQSAHNNPLMQASDLPLEAPPFDKIKADDFQQAFDSGMKKQLEEIRSEEHTSELQSRGQIVCRLLLETKNKIRRTKN